MILVSGKTGAPPQFVGIPQQAFAAGSFARWWDLAGVSRRCANHFTVGTCCDILLPIAEPDGLRLKRKVVRQRGYAFARFFSSHVIDVLTDQTN